MFVQAFGNSATALLRVLDASHDQDGSFARTIRDDLGWLGIHSIKFADMESPPATLYPWLNFSSTTSWRSHLLNATIMIIGYTSLPFLTHV